MLESLRKWTTGYVAFVLIGLLILSFALWGVADVFTGVTRGALVSVGDKEISERDYREELQNELAALSQRAQRRITLEQARALGLDRQVLNRMIGSAALEAQADQLDLALSDEAVVDGLRKDEAFQGIDGKFSPALLEGAMRRLGLSEKALIALRRQDELRQHITTALLRATVVPDQMVSSLHDWRQEKRQVRHFTIDAGKVVTLKDPDEDTLKKTYEDNKSSFMTPELRHLSVLHLSKTALKKKAPITDEQLKTAYEKTKSLYDKPERREIQQIAFADGDAAAKAKAEIAAGKDFLEVAKATGATETDVDLGLRTKDELIDKTIADAAFALPDVGVVSEPVTGRFTTVLVRVTRIVNGRESTFDEVKDKVREILADEWAIDRIRSLFDQVDEGRAAAMPLKEIATDLELPYFDVPETDRSNRKLDKSLALDVVDGGTIASRSFSGDVGEEIDAIELSDGSYAWVDVVGITKPKQKPFEEVRAEVEKLWREEETRKAISEVAGKYVERIKNGEAMEKVAEEAGGEVILADPVTRSGIPNGLTQAAMSQAFVLPEGGVSSSLTSDRKSRVVFRVTDIIPAEKPDETEMETLEEELAQQLRADQFTGYLAAVQEDLGVTINEGMLARITGARTP